MKAQFLVFMAALSIGPVALHADGAPGAASVTAPANPPAPDPSRDQVCGPLHMIIWNVVSKDDSFVISGGMATNAPIEVTMLRNLRGNSASACGGTSLGGDPYLPCTTVTLGDNPDNDSPTISLVPGTTYNFSLTIKIPADSSSGLQELRIGLRFGNQSQILRFPNLKPSGPPPAAQVNGPDAQPQPPAPIVNDNNGGQQNPTATPGDAPAARNGANRNSSPDNGSSDAVGASARTPGGSDTPVPVTLADRQAQSLMTALDSSLGAGQWKVAATQVKQLQTIDKNGYQGTELSDNLQATVDGACTVDSAKVQLGTLAQPKTAAQYLKRASLEIDAKEATEAGNDLMVVAKNVKQLNWFQKAEFGMETARCANLTSNGGN